MIEDRKLAAALAKRKEERTKEKARGIVDIGIHEVVRCIICGSAAMRKDGLECYMCRKEAGYCSFSKAATVTGRYLMNREAKYMLGYSAGQSGQEGEDDA